MSRLRNLFADAAGIAISWGPGGYVLEADPLSVDVHRFRHWASRARASADPVEATDLFERGLSNWGGQPFAALDTAWISDVRDALVAERFSVVLDRNDVALSAGRHGELLGELTAASAAHPLDERLAGQLMLAQYRSGRQADALGTYRSIRQRLVEELGVYPGPALQAVHQQILAGSPEDHVAKLVAGSPPGSAVPRGLVAHRPTSEPVPARDQLRQP